MKRQGCLRRRTLKYTLINYTHTYTASASASVMWRVVHPVKRKTTVSCLGLGSGRGVIIVSVSLGEKQQTVPVADVSLLMGTSSTLSLLIQQRRGPGGLFQKCEFNGIVVRQTQVLYTLHSCYQHTNTHKRHVQGYCVRGAYGWSHVPACLCVLIFTCVCVCV